MKARFLGIDYGLKRIGLAISDPLGMFAQPRGVFSPSTIFEELKKIGETEQVACVVVGWPLKEDGTEGAATERVSAFINRLKRQFPDWPIALQDERYSSKEAMQALIDAGVRPRARRKKGRLDTAAATIILQSYLNEQ